MFVTAICPKEVNKVLKTLPGEMHQKKKMWRNLKKSRSKEMGRWERKAHESRTPVIQRRNGRGRRRICCFPSCVLIMQDRKEASP